MSIRAWTQADIAQISEIERRCFADAWSVVAFEDILKYPMHHSFLVEREGKILGYACLLVLFEDAEIENIAVDLPYRRQGIGRKLMEEMHEKAKSLGAKRCLLEVRVSNISAISLYEKYGYEKYGVRKRYYPDGEDAFVMQKRL
ncbi:MAG: ribosomal-protein-alanine N-acetyltransferase [Clostridiales bacterium]|nr:ribosomal-protein-alanine N-acetyltransferase [Clostridiales bacterium]